jgi:hypothetical protein
MPRRQLRPWKARRFLTIRNPCIANLLGKKPLEINKALGTEGVLLEDLEPPPDPHCEVHRLREDHPPEEAVMHDMTLTNLEMVAGMAPILAVTEVLGPTLNLIQEVAGAHLVATMIGRVTIGVHVDAIMVLQMSPDEKDIHHGEVMMIESMVTDTIVIAITAHHMMPEAMLLQGMTTTVRSIEVVLHPMHLPLLQLHRPLPMVLLLILLLRLLLLPRDPVHPRLKIPNIPRNRMPLIRQHHLTRKALRPVLNRNHRSHSTLLKIILSMRKPQLLMHLNTPLKIQPARQILHATRHPAMVNLATQILLQPQLVMLPHLHLHLHLLPHLLLNILGAIIVLLVPNPRSPRILPRARILHSHLSRPNPAMVLQPSLPQPPLLHNLLIRPPHLPILTILLVLLATLPLLLPPLLNLMRSILLSRAVIRQDSCFFLRKRGKRDAKKEGRILVSPNFPSFFGISRLSTSLRQEHAVRPSKLSNFPKSLMIEAQRP